jgi:short-subunit dehydrogenase
MGNTVGNSERHNARSRAGGPLAWTDPPVWLITGSSSGLGYALACEAISRGYRVVATSRHPEALDTISSAAQSDRLLPVELDVTDRCSVQRGTAQAIKAFGRIDVLINNAGTGSSGAVEEATDDEIQAIFESNVFGLLRVTRAILPYMRAQRSGYIYNISSLGGFRSRAGIGLYSATKFAIEGLSEALLEEVTPLGIKVVLVDPGHMATAFRSRNIRHSERSIPDYSALLDPIKKTMRQQYPASIPSPRRAATFILDAHEKGWVKGLRLWTTKESIAGVRAKLGSVYHDVQAVENLVCG